MQNFAMLKCLLEENKADLRVLRVLSLSLFLETGFFCVTLTVLELAM